jgi:feruloyl-CoA synthase
MALSRNGHWEVRAMSIFVPMREVRLPEPAIDITRRADGSMILRSRRKLPPYPAKATEMLDHWAARTPERLFMAKRGPGGDWVRLTYGETRAKARRIAAALLARGLSAERPLVILSGNDLEHMLLNMAAYYAGVPYAPVSPSYSLLSQDFAKLKHIVSLLTPGLVYVSDAAAYGKALAAAVPAGIEVATAGPIPADRPMTPFAQLLGAENEVSVDAAHAGVGPDTIAKFLFTSGSTGTPKGVINTQGMICSNQAMIRDSFPFLADTPPVIVDWLPWHHTFGGNHNIGIILFNGGSFYIDDGKPTPVGIVETVRNLREISPTIYFNVPKGYEELVLYLDTNVALRRRFFSRLQMLFFAGAGMAQYVFDELDRLALEACGQRVIIMSGLGATETAPSAMFCVRGMTQSGAIGLPVAGVELKLAPLADGRLEARLKGPSVTPGYWRAPEATAASYDEEGFYKLGDAVRFADEADPLKGLFFDGRLAEDFKLSSGSWVHVGPLRAQLIAALAPYARDVVITGHERDEIGVLVFPDFEACRLNSALADATPAEIISDPDVRALFRDRLTLAADAATGSSNRVARAMLLHEPPSLDGNELTDKGSINQRAVLIRRAALVEALYGDQFADFIIYTSDRR